MKTPVASLRVQSSYHFDNLILIQLKSSFQSGNLIRQGLQIKLTQNVLLVNDVLRHSPHQLAILTS